jgi:hypothetical protein
VSEDFGEFVEIAAVHHVPRSESVTQIVEMEILDTGSFEQVLETSLTLCLSLLVPFFGRNIRSPSFANASQ